MNLTKLDFLIILATAVLTSLTFNLFSCGA